jgi:hypothetical protein
MYEEATHDEVIYEEILGTAHRDQEEGKSRNARSFPMSLAMTYDGTQSHLPIYGSSMLRDLANVPAKLNRVCIIKVCFHKVFFLSRRHEGVICFVTTQALRYSR